MPVIITMILKPGEKIICEKCSKKIIENETAFLDLNWYRETPEKVYCNLCKEKVYPWL